MNIDKYPDSPRIERTLRIIEALAGHTMTGLAPMEIAAAIKASPSAVTRTLAQLLRRAVVEECRTKGRYRLGPALVQIAQQHLLEVDRAKRLVDEVEQRFSRAVN